MCIPIPAVLHPHCHSGFNGEKISLDFTLCDNRFHLFFHPIQFPTKAMRQCIQRLCQSPVSHFFSVHQVDEIIRVQAHTDFPLKRKSACGCVDYTLHHHRLNAFTGFCQEQR